MLHILGGEKRQDSSNQAQAIQVADAQENRRIWSLLAIRCRNDRGEGSLLARKPLKSMLETSQISYL
jgi:hypothetical protein